MRRFTRVPMTREDTRRSEPMVRLMPRPASAPAETSELRDAQHADALPSSADLYEGARLALEGRAEAHGPDRPGPASAYDSIIAAANRPEGKAADASAESPASVPGGSRARLEQEADQVAASQISATSTIENEPPSSGTAATTLSESLRSHFSSVLGTDLSDVRIRTDVDPGDPDLGEAHAVTSGTEIKFAPDRFRPDLPLGRALIGHELAHVAQQKRGAALSRLAPVRPVGHDGLAHLQSLASGGPGLDYRGALAAFRSQHPAADLAARRAEIQDPSTPRGLSPAPPGMKQRCLFGCSDRASEQKDAGTPAPAAPTEGLTARAKAKALLDSDAKIKGGRDKVEHALREIRAGQALDFHTTSTVNIVTGLGGTASDWQWFLDHGPPGAKARASDKEWNRRRNAFLGKFQGDFEKLIAKFKYGAFAKSWVKNTPASIFQLIHDVTRGTNISPAFLYAAAANEGLVDVYVVRKQAPGTEELTEAQMSSIRLDLGVDGFQALGLDDFFSDLDLFKGRPAEETLRHYLPPGLDLTRQVTESTNTNEEPRTVRSANTKDLKTALQLKVAELRWRMFHFERYRTQYGYAAPTTEQLVFFTYATYNAGIFGVRGTLQAHKPGGKSPRKLQDWIDKKEYAHAQRVLSVYKTIVAAGLLPG
jgi:Domain of unknown function (DUF4157)